MGLSWESLQGRKGEVKGKRDNEREAGGRARERWVVVEGNGSGCRRGRMEEKNDEPTTLQPRTCEKGGEGVGGSGGEEGRVSGEEEDQTRSGLLRRFCP